MEGVHQSGFIVLGCVISDSIFVFLCDMNILLETSGAMN